MDGNKFSLNPTIFMLLLLAYLLAVAKPSDAADRGTVLNSHANRGDPGKGSWQLLLNNTGVVATHMVLTHHNTVVMLDQTGSGPSSYQLRRRPSGTWCVDTPHDLSDPTCYAHSVEYDLARNDVRALNIHSDTWCSSGSLLSNGTLVQTGGYGSGSRHVRYFQPCRNERCDWTESSRHLSDDRSYSSSLKLPGENEEVILFGGKNVFSYEFVPRRKPNEGAFYLQFLQNTYEKNEGDNNLYPIIHLSTDGNLFVFANRDSILFNYKRNRVEKYFPRIPGKGSRTHPSGGSSVILPLDHKDGYGKVEVMICGGASYGAYAAAKDGRFMTGMSTCGRMVITGDNHRWKMENMPGPRIMSSMILFPTGHVIIINGAQMGCAGLNSAASPSLQPYLYKPKRPAGERFSVLRSTEIARMYQSSAVLLPDGRVLVAGSNPNEGYMFNNVTRPTELRLEAFTPRHMEERFHLSRPRNVSIIYTEMERQRRQNHTWSLDSDPSDNGVAYGREFDVRFLSPETHGFVFTAYAPPFNTHGQSMNQRLVILRSRKVWTTKEGWQRATLEVPKSPNVAPAGYYMLSVVTADGIPSEAKWVRFVHA